MATSAKRKSSTDKSLYNEIVAIILVALALLTILCLFTYSSTDASGNTASSFEQQNWAGIVGAYIADILFQSIGNFAYAIPFLFIFVAWKIFRTKAVWFPVARIVGIFLFVLTGTGLLTLFGSNGGLTGAAIAKLFSSLLSPIGAGILLVAGFLASTILITNVSFASFVDSFNMGFENLRIHLNEWLESRRKRRAKYAQESTADDEKKASVKTSAQPKINAKESEEATVNLNEKIDDTYPTIDNQPEITKLEEMISSNSASTAAAVAPVVTRGFAESEEKVAPKRGADFLSNAKKSIEAGNKEKGATQDFGDYQIPKFEFLTEAPKQEKQDEEEARQTGRLIVSAADEFNVKGSVKNINLGPVVATYEFKPAAGVKYARVTSLADDLCLALRAESIMIERIPGKAVVGMEVPNANRETIYLRDVIDSPSGEFRNSDSKLTIALGKAVDGTRFVSDLATMPHLLIAGATGSGKSVGVNSLIVSILYKASPEEVKFIMVDPKRLELGLYADIPHLATPIITDPKRAAIALGWAVSEMERRYKDVASWGVRNISGYNKAVEKRNNKKDYDENGEPHKILPYIVVIIDELADLMLVSGKDVEYSIQRLAQMARAVGIHLVLATQRPSVDVITGVIKANFPSRIAFRVSSKIDSRTILDTNGAEKLLGRGDMLFLPPRSSRVVRVHGAYVDEAEIKKIVTHIKKQGDPSYDESITKSKEEVEGIGELPGKGDELYEKALLTFANANTASTSLLQRNLRIGYGRAAAIIDALAAEGYVGAMDGSKRGRSVTEKGKRKAQEIEERNRANEY